MKFTLSWLKDHLRTEASLADIVATLTRIGLEVEHVDNPGERLAGFVTARLIEANRHPNADRLRVCSVDVGGAAPVQVVCGAPNARTGMASVFSPPGAYIPGKKITLGAGVIRARCLSVWHSARKTPTSRRLSRSVSCAASATARRPPGCSGACGRSASGQSALSWTSRIT